MHVPMPAVQPSFIIYAGPAGWENASVQTVGIEESGYRVSAHTKQSVTGGNKRRPLWSPACKPLR